MLVFGVGTQKNQWVKISSPDEKPKQPGSTSRQLHEVFLFLQRTRRCSAHGEPRANRLGGEH